MKRAASILLLVSVVAFICAVTNRTLDYMKAKEQEAEAKGAQKQILKQLKDDFDCSDKKTAKKLLEKMENELKDLDVEIEEAIEEVKEKYDL